MGRLSKKLVSIVATVVVASTTLGQAAVVSAQDNAAENNIQVSDENASAESASAATGTSVDDGVMLHAWNWSFNNIKDNMKQIAEAGYTAVQTSPAQACRNGKTWDDAAKEQTNDNPTWYYLYQPTYFTLGNDYLGNDEEFKAMCDEAHKYGVKIVVDVVANHLANVTENSEDHKDKVDDKLYEDARKCSGPSDPNRINDWKDRKQVTQGCCIGMPDIDTTKDSAVNAIGGYLQQLVESGADGFRFDAAKSIELPSAYETASNAVSSDFWPKVLGMAKEKNPDVFYYGEVLQGDEPGTNALGYTNIMRITASHFSQLLRSSVGYDAWQEEITDENGNKKDVINGWGKDAGKGEVSITTPTVKNLDWNHISVIEKNPSATWGEETITEDKYVGYFENHDLYANAGATRAMTKDQRELCWAMLSARKDIVPLFFNRPVDIDFGENMYKPVGEAYKPMGEKGSDDFISDNVAVMNRFHTKMINESETLEGLEKNTVFKATRGSKGVVLVNVSTSSKEFSTDTSLSDGANIYKSKDDVSATLSGGKIKVTLPAQSFVVLSTEDLSKTELPDVSEDTKPTITVKDSDGNTLKSGTTENKFDDKTTVKVSLKDAKSATYKLGDGEEEELTDGKEITIDKTEDLVINAINGTAKSSVTYKFVKNGVEAVKPTISAKFGDTSLEDGTAAKITKADTLVVSFKDAESVSYVIDGKTKTATDEELEAKKITLEDFGDGLEAGDTKSVKVTAKNGEESVTNTYTVEMKDSGSEVAKDASFVAKIGTKTLGLSSVEFKDSAKISLAFENAVSATYTVGDNTKKNAIDIDEDGNATITVGKDVEEGEEFIVKVSALNADNKATSATFTLKKAKTTTTPIDKFEFTSAEPDKTTAKINEDITITCKAVAPTDNIIKYALYSKKDGEEEVQETAKIMSNVLTWQGAEAGEYNLRVVAYCGTQQLEKNIKVTVEEEKVEAKKLTVSLTTKDATMELGQTIKLSAASENADGKVKYKFVRIKDGDESWKAINNYSEDNFAEWTPSEVGTYEVAVLAQDDTYNNDNEDENSKYVDSKTIKVVVKEKTQEQKPSASGTPEEQKPTSDATSALPLVGMVFASAAALVRKIKKQK